MGRIAPVTADIASPEPDEHLASACARAGHGPPFALEGSEYLVHLGIHGGCQHRRIYKFLGKAGRDLHDLEHGGLVQQTLDAPELVLATRVHRCEHIATIDELVELPVEVDPCALVLG